MEEKKVAKKPKKETVRKVRGSRPTTDPIADMLTRIRNAIQAKMESVIVPLSKTKKEIARILGDEGYIAKYVVMKDESGHSIIHITFKQVEGTQRVIQGLRRISKPGLRVYAGVQELPKVLNGMGIAIISTSKGIMTDEAARTAGLGGEVIAYIW